MLAYCVEWHMRERLKPMLVDDEHIEQTSAAGVSQVAKTQHSEHAKARDATQSAEDGSPLHSFRTQRQVLATLDCNFTLSHLNAEAKIVTPRGPRRPRAFRLLGVNPACAQ